jgi:hypothetical protein
MGRDTSSAIRGSLSDWNWLDQFVADSNNNLYASFHTICGPTSLWAVLDQIGLESSLSDILNAIDFDPTHGTEFTSLAEGAKALGGYVTSCSLDGEQVANVLRTQSETAVLYEISEGHVVGVLGQLDDGSLSVLNYPRHEKKRPDRLSRGKARPCLVISKHPPVSTVSDQGHRARLWVGACLIALGAGGTLFLVRRRRQAA